MIGAERTDIEQRTHLVAVAEVDVQAVDPRRWRHRCGIAQVHAQAEGEGQGAGLGEVVVVEHEALESILDAARGHRDRPDPAELARPAPSHRAPNSGQRAASWSGQRAGPPSRHRAAHSTIGARRPAWAPGAPRCLECRGAGPAATAVEGAAPERKVGVARSRPFSRRRGTRRRDAGQYVGEAALRRRSRARSRSRASASMLADVLRQRVRARTVVAERGDRHGPSARPCGTRAARDPNPRKCARTCRSRRCAQRARARSATAWIAVAHDRAKASNGACAMCGIAACGGLRTIRHDAAIAAIRSHRAGLGVQRGVHELEKASVDPVVAVQEEHAAPACPGEADVARGRRRPRQPLAGRRSDDPLPRRRRIEIRRLVGRAVIDDQASQSGSLCASRLSSVSARVFRRCEPG